MTLTEFLLARISEDELAAISASGQGRKWESLGGMAVRAAGSDRDRPVVKAQNVRVGQHVARHDPARVLAECDAKRRIVEIVYEATPTRGFGMDRLEGWTSLGAAAMALLAMPYADHPDYQDEWRP